MTILLETNTAYWNDLYDVARLFYGDAPILREAEAYALRIRHTAGARGDEVSLDNADRTIDAETLAHAFDAADTLEQKRLEKRAAKTALYRLLKRYTGRTQTWGSLTGIRPSRLFREGLARFGDEEAAVNWLTGTFDVPKEKALQLRDMAREQARLPAPQPDECDIYVGIPFCATRCSYCAFAAVDLQTGSKWIGDYLAALSREIAHGETLMREAGYRARAVYVGGGTPTALPAAALDALLGQLRGLFPEAVEWTVEAGRPDTIDQEKLTAIRAHGVGRISVNPQTMNDRTLAAIGRAHTARDILDAYALVRKAGFPVVNMDLIAALPGEGVAEITHTVREILSLRPENITLHTLAIKRASALRIEGNAAPPPPGLALDMYEAARGLLADAGYRAYYLYRQKYMAGNLENIGLSLPGMACLYNIDHMEETAPILACGAGAITKWLFDRERRIERSPNVRDVPSYIARVDEMIERKRTLLLPPK